MTNPNRIPRAQTSKSKVTKIEKKEKKEKIKAKSRQAKANNKVEDIGESKIDILDIGESKTDI